MIQATQLLEILEGNRRLTIRTVEAFPDDQLFSYSIGGMRPFGEMVVEVLCTERSYVRGIATGEWKLATEYSSIRTKADLLAACEEVRHQTKSLWPQVTADRLQAVESDGLYGDWEQPNLDRVVYMWENEIHHRAQGFVYLRALGIEPPAFYER